MAIFVAYFNIFIIVFCSLRVFSAPVPQKLADPKSILGRGIDYWNSHNCTFPPSSSYDLKEGYMSQCDKPYDHGNPSMVQEMCKDIVDLSIAICAGIIGLGVEGTSRIKEDKVNRNIADYGGQDAAKICAKFQILKEAVPEKWLKEWKKGHSYMNDLLTDGEYGCQHLCSSQQESQNSFLCTTIYILTASILTQDTTFARGSNLTYIAPADDNIPSGSQAMLALGPISAEKSSSTVQDIKNDAGDSEPVPVQGGQVTHELTAEEQAQYAQDYATGNQGKSKSAVVIEKQLPTQVNGTTQKMNNSENLLTPLEAVSDDLNQSQGALARKSSLLNKVNAVVPQPRIDADSKAVQEVASNLNKANSQAVELMKPENSGIVQSSNTTKRTPDSTENNSEIVQEQAKDSTGKQNPSASLVPGQNNQGSPPNTEAQNGQDRNSGYQPSKMSDAGVKELYQSANPKQSTGDTVAPQDGVQTATKNEMIGPDGEHQTIVDKQPTFSNPNYHPNTGIGANGQGGSNGQSTAGQAVQVAPGESHDGIVHGNLGTKNQSQIGQGETSDASKSKMNIAPIEPPTPKPLSTLVKLSTDVIVVPHNQMKINATKDRADTDDGFVLGNGTRLAPVQLQNGQNLAQGQNGQGQPGQGVTVQRQWPTGQQSPEQQGQGQGGQQGQTGQQGQEQQGRGQLGQQSWRGQPGQIRQQEQTGQQGDVAQRKTGQQNQLVPGQTGQQDLHGRGPTGQQGQEQQGLGQTGPQGQIGQEQAGQTQNGQQGVSGQQGINGQRQQRPGGHEQTGQGQSEQPQTGQGQSEQTSRGQGQYNQAGQGQFNQAGQGQTGQVASEQTGQGQSVQTQTGHVQSGQTQTGQGQYNQAGQVAGGQGQSEQTQTGQGQSGEIQTGQGQYNQAGQVAGGQGQYGQGQSGQTQTGQGQYNQAGQVAGGQGQYGQTQTGQGQSGQTQTGQGQYNQAGQVAGGQGQSGQIQTGQGQSGQTQTGQGQSGQTQTEQGQNNQAGQGQSGQTQTGQGQNNQAGQGQTGQVATEQDSVQPTPENGYYGGTDYEAGQTDGNTNTNKVSDNTVQSRPIAGGNSQGVPNLYEEDVERADYQAIDDQYEAIPDKAEETMDSSYRKQIEEVATSSHFMAYFITMVVVCILGYVLFHNKKKVFAIILEGRSARTPRRRATSSGDKSSEVKYEKLSQNVDELLSSTDKTVTTQNYIY